MSKLVDEDHSDEYWLNKGLIFWLGLTLLESYVGGFDIISENDFVCSHI